MRKPQKLTEREKLSRRTLVLFAAPVLSFATMFCIGAGLDYLRFFQERALAEAVTAFLFGLPIGIALVWLALRREGVPLWRDPSLRDPSCLPSPSPNVLVHNGEHLTVKTRGWCYYVTAVWADPLKGGLTRIGAERGNLTAILRPSELRDRTNLDEFLKTATPQPDWNYRPFSIERTARTLGFVLLAVLGLVFVGLGGAAVWDNLDEGGYIPHDEMTIVYSPNWQNGEYKTCSTLNGNGGESPNRVTPPQNILCDGGVPSGRLEDGKVFNVRFWGKTYFKGKQPGEFLLWKCRKNDREDPAITCKQATEQSP